jgi:exodeoxyribonuclease VII small subunit
VAKSSSTSASGSASGSSHSPSEVESLSFEEAVARLETIVSDIESGEVGLEEAVKRYGEGVALVARCKAILNVAEQKVEELKVKLTDTPAE